MNGISYRLLRFALNNNDQYVVIQIDHYTASNHYPYANVCVTFIGEDLTLHGVSGRVGNVVWWRVEYYTTVRRIASKPGQGGGIGSASALNYQQVMK